MMHNTNYLNMRDGDEDRQIYRIISMTRLYELFASRENVLVRPSKWEDPFENFILNADAQLTDGTIVRFGFNNDFYGQCWTLTAKSDAMWRIYSPQKESVRIRTTVKKLAKSLSAGLNDRVHEHAFVGKVLYLRDKPLLDFANKVFADGLDPVALAKTLLVKRNAFTHEKEVRLLYLEKEDRPEQDVFRYSIDPHAMIDQIMIDPRLSKHKVEALKQEIKGKTGFTGAIKRSLLYAPPKGMIFPIGA